jgi:hypothetical protein
LHYLGTKDIEHQYNTPGIYKDTPKAIGLKVGGEASGGVYKPPQYSGDIKLFMSSLIVKN